MKKALILLLLSLNSYSSVTHEQFLQLKEALFLTFEDLKPFEQDILTINTTANGLPDNYWWNLDMVHASYTRIDNQHNIFLFGGFARLEKMTLDGLAVTACHEIGHGIGGAPYKSTGSSMEGQADYFATKVCLPNVFKHLPQTSEIRVTEFNHKYCEQSEDQTYCLRALNALESDIHFYETLGDIVHFHTPSEEVATQLNDHPTFYPSSQCRLDTSLAGVLKEPRPICWYPL
ncbi:putative exported protein [Halobacteriovorax marinus SJ]|uniref:Exported protein n=1 Tax=Halobacteriovorax marinus (strain ATCC BAA-682 / DSM 15412 / SJ) TaxID=862908 RepID=E1X0G5_HALMS|nr:hypothetical protein [Halobacteriovorax marinus]CBW27991.1 putative exported protein [Halobacteriovorax marinus SJ]